MQTIRQNKIPWELIISYFRKDISAEEQEELMRWAADPESRALLEELQELWDKIQAKTADYTPDKAYYWEELNRRLRLKEEADRQRALHKPSRWRLFRRLAVVASLLLVVGLAYYLGKDAGQSQQTEQVYSCLSGKSKVLLPDGSVVWLHGHTTLTCGSDFLKEERAVELTGEAYFEVTPDSKRPFIVQTDGMQVMVHGTKFTVEALVGASESRVTLVDGSVSMSTLSEQVYLKPGETAVYDRINHRLKRAYADLRYETLWTKEQMEVANQPLGEVCRLLERWYSVTIHLDEALRERYHYTFTLRTESLEEVLRLMSRIHPIAYRFDDKDVLTITSPQE